MPLSSLALLVLVAPLVGCAAAGGAAGTASTSRAGLVGVAKVGPTCGFSFPASPCPDRPIKAKLRVVPVGSDNAVAATVTDPEGHFRIPLQPGTYVVHATPAKGGVVPVAAPMRVVVRPGRFTRVTVSFDSGIR